MRMSAAAPLAAITTSPTPAPRPWVLLCLPLAAALLTASRFWTPPYPPPPGSCRRRDLDHSNPSHSNNWRRNSKRRSTNKRHATGGGRQADRQHAFGVQSSFSLHLSLHLRLVSACSLSSEVSLFESWCTQEVAQVEGWHREEEGSL